MKKEVEVKTSENNKKRNIILIVVGLLLLIIILFLLWFFNRKFDVVFDYNNGAKNETVLVKYNKVIKSDDIKTKDDLGEKFLGWYLVTNVDGKEKLSEKPFDFETKISKDIHLKALYDGKVETITVSFDTKGGSKIEDIIINKDSELTLPTSPTYKGYTFKGWVDKNNRPIYNKAKLSEDTTLYAVWEKVEEKAPEVKNETPAPEPTPTPEPTPEIKEEKISLTLSNYYINLLGTKTSNAIAKTVNPTGEITYKITENKCVSIDSKTGLITALQLSRFDRTYCSTNEFDLVVTATLPSGKSASQTIHLEKDLVLSAKGKNSVNLEFGKYDDKSFSNGTNEFKISANQNVTWSSTNIVDGTFLTNSTSCSGKLNTDKSMTATIVATTKGGQKLELVFTGAIN